MVYCAAKFDIADHLTQRSMNADELAEVTGTHSPSLFRLLRGLVNIGILKADSENRFSVTELGELLRSDVNGSSKNLALLHMGPHYAAAGMLSHTIKTGETSFDRVFGCNYWQFMKTNTKEGEYFMKAQTEFTQAFVTQLTNSYNYNQFSNIVDVGGGNGSLLISILEKYPSTKGVVFDENDVIEKTAKIVEKSSVSDRCSVIAGNFFESIPANGDCYLMKHIVHDWDDENVLVILRNIRKVMKPNGKLLVIDAVLPDNCNEKHPFIIEDVCLLHNMSGKERTRKEFEYLFAESGFRAENIIIVNDCPLNIIEASIQ
ncbi:hypothetical protein B4U80_13056 [Leptotrombidium deliense]|uniref:Acetylserotonin O-methyltransferase n=1 Tax=Leptotrombidium deliense TaxID=299467 RepID=A0A443SDR5_9ACAR|nr:hypothetical protein B4U80_13056 [Leptotrombidium deliense]